MFSKDAVHSFAQALLRRASSNEIDWILDGSKFVVETPALQAVLSRREVPPDIIFEVNTPQGRPVGIVEIKSDDPEFKDFDVLLKHAEGYSESWNTKLREAARSIELGSGKIAGMAQHTTVLSPPLPPDRPSEEQIKQFFSNIAGKWSLRFEKRTGGFGDEMLEIDSVGNYFTITAIRGRDAARTIFPKYRLLLVSCNEDLTDVEIAKQELNGKQRQIEVLHIENDVMAGYAKHDEHGLMYRRR